MWKLENISSDTFAADWAKGTGREGWVASAAIGLSLLLGTLTGHPAGGAIAAGAAFTVGFAMFHPVMGSVLTSMLLVSAGIASATLAGSLSAAWTAAVMVVVGVAALNYGVLSGLGAAAGWIGQQSGVFLVVATYFAGGPRYAVGRASAVLAGGMLQIVLHGVFLRVFLRHRKPAVGTGAEGATAAVGAVVRRLREYWRRLPEDLRPGGETLPYALRLTVTLLLATAVYRTAHLRNGYWVPMTALLVLKPQWTGTRSRSIARLSGTLAGAMVAYGLAHIQTWPAVLLGVLVMLFAWVCYALQAVNYALFSCAITLYIVFLFRFGGFSEHTAAHLRLMNTAIGGCLALLVDFVWQGVPRWREAVSK